MHIQTPLYSGAATRALKKLLIAAAIATVALTIVGSLGSPATAHEYAGDRKARRHVVSRALNQLGTRYLWGGESPNNGFDCSGLTKWAYSGHGAELPHQSLMQYELGNDRGYKRIRSRRDLKRGDIVAFKTTSAKVGHVGLYIGKGRFVSAVPSSGGVAIDSVNDPYYWGDRWVGATRVRF